MTLGIPIKRRTAFRDVSAVEHPWSKHESISGDATSLGKCSLYGCDTWNKIDMCNIYFVNCNWMNVLCNQDPTFSYSTNFELNRWLGWNSASISGFTFNHWLTRLKAFKYPSVNEIKQEKQARKSTTKSGRQKTPISGDIYAWCSLSSSVTRW